MSNNGREKGRSKDERKRERESILYMSGANKARQTFLLFLLFFWVRAMRTFFARPPAQVVGSTYAISSSSSSSSSSSAGANRGASGNGARLCQEEASASLSLFFFFLSSPLSGIRMDKHNLDAGHSRVRERGKRGQGGSQRGRRGQDPALPSALLLPLPPPSLRFSSVSSLSRLSPAFSVSAAFWPSRIGVPRLLKCLDKLLLLHLFSSA